MAYVMAVLLLILVAGLVLRAVVVSRRSSGRRDDADVTDRSARPPAHPRETLPGSATRRREQGKP